MALKTQLALIDKRNLTVKSLADSVPGVYGGVQETLKQAIMPQCDAVDKLLDLLDKL